jgi:hypothetical protein
VRAYYGRVLRRAVNETRAYANRQGLQAACLAAILGWAVSWAGGDGLDVSSVVYVIAGIAILVSAAFLRNLIRAPVQLHADALAGSTAAEWEVVSNVVGHGTWVARFWRPDPSVLYFDLESLLGRSVEAVRCVVTAPNGSTAVAEDPFSRQLEPREEVSFRYPDAFADASSVPSGTYAVQWLVRTPRVRGAILVADASFDVGG